MTVTSQARGFVLGYHDVVTSRAPSSGFSHPAARRYKFNETDFRQHVQALSRARAEVPMAFCRAADMPISGTGYALTFDDGGVSAELVADILEARDWRGYFFVATSFIGTDGFLTPASIADLAGRGHVIGSHSHTHPDMIGRLDPSSVRGEWTQSLDILQDIIGSRVTAASVPGGSTSPIVEHEAAAAGIEVLFTSEPRAKPSRRDGCAVIGRYMLYGADTAATAAAIVRGDLAPRLRRSAAWNSRKAGKKLLGKQYMSIRRALLR
jgi:peptidoglycan/xylan/chitin deacetylase (PgdA/CDA1 family)